MGNNLDNNDMQKDKSAEEKRNNGNIYLLFVLVCFIEAWRISLSTKHTKIIGNIRPEIIINIKNVICAILLFAATTLITYTTIKFPKNKLAKVMHILGVLIFTAYLFLYLIGSTCFGTAVSNFIEQNIMGGFSKWI